MIAISEFKLESQSEKAQFHKNRTPIYATASFVHHFVACVNSNCSNRPGTPELVPNFTSVTLTFLWSSFLSMVITPEIFVMIQGEGHCVTDRQTDRHRRTDGRTETSVRRAAWSQLIEYGIRLVSLFCECFYIIGLKMLLVSFVVTISRDVLAPLAVRYITKRSSIFCY